MLLCFCVHRPHYHWRRPVSQEVHLHKLWIELHVNVSLSFTILTTDIYIVLSIISVLLIDVCLLHLLSASVSLCFCLPVCICAVFYSLTLSLQRLLSLQLRLWPQRIINDDVSCHKHRPNVLRKSSWQHNVSA